MRNLNLFFCKKTFLVLFYVLYISFAEAETTNEEPPSSNIYGMSLEELLDVKVNVASHFEDSELDVGSSVSAITSETWKRQGAKRTLDAIAGMQSTMVYQSLGGTQGVAVRGYPSSVSSNRGIALIIDGVPVNNVMYETGFYTKGNFNLGALEKIEMIRGPGSSLYGTDAFHGVVSFVTPTLTKDTTETVVQSGSFGSYDLGIKFSRGILGKLRFSGNYSVSGQKNEEVPYSYTDYTTNQNMKGHQKRLYQGQTAVAKFNYDTAELGFYWNLWKANGFPNVINTFPFISGSQSGNNSGFTMIQLKDSWTLPEKFEMEARLFSWAESNEFHYGTQAGVADDESESSTVNLPGSATPFLLPSAYDQKFQTQREGLSLIVKRPAIDIPTRLVFGYSLDHHKVKDATFQGRGTAETKGGGVGKLRDVNGIFIQTDTGFLEDDRLHLLAGLRYDQYSEGWSHVSPRAGIIYHQDKLSALKFLYGHAFRAPSAAEVTFSGKILGNPDLSPEQIDTYELVYMRHSKEWRYDLTLFTSRWTNGIQNVADSTLPIGYSSQYRNISKSEAMGYEVKGERFLTRSLRLNGNFSQTRSSMDLNGVRTDYIAFPDYIVNWGVEYDIPLTRMNFNFNNQYRFNQRTAQIVDLSTGSKAINNEVTLPPYMRSDLGISWDLSNNLGTSRITMSLRNIFNRVNSNPSIWNIENGVSESGISAVAGYQSTF